jgi:hypothetical protein
VDGVASPARVRLDGPSLLIVRGEAAEQRVPFARLARLVLRGRVALEGDVLPVLLRQGRSVTLLAGNGRALGFVVPLEPRPLDLAMLVEEAAQLPDWPHHLEAFRAAEERRALAGLAARLRGVGGETRRRTLERRVRGLIGERLGSGDAPLAGDALLARLEALLRAEVGQALVAWGAGARLQDPSRPELDLAGLAAGVLAVELWPLALGLADYLAARGRRLSSESALQRRLVARFEAERERRERLTAGLIGRLRRRLLELVR